MKNKNTSGFRFLVEKQKQNLNETFYFQDRLGFNRDIKRIFLAILTYQFFNFYFKGDLKGNGKAKGKK